MTEGRVIQRNDSTVAQPHHLRTWAGPIFGRYPPHTRIMRRANWAIIRSIAYTVTQVSARKILYEIVLKSLRSPFDIILAKFCKISNTCVKI